jgi:hypothetical protein
MRQDERRDDAGYQDWPGIDGRQLDPKALQDLMPFTNAVSDACSNPNEETVRRMIEISTDRKIKNC